MSILPDPVEPGNNLAEGQARRDAAHVRLEDHQPEVIRQLRVAMLRVSLEQGEVTADDVRAVVPIPVGMSKNIVGAAFAGLTKTGIFKKVDYRPSKRAIANAHNLAVWQLVNQAEALTRLNELLAATD